MIALEHVTLAAMEHAAAQAGIILPIEQTEAWGKYQAKVPGRHPWGAFLIRRDNELIAVISLIDYETHGYHYLRSLHGPAWKTKPSQDEEREVVDALAKAVHAKDHKVAFLRVDTWFEDGYYRVLSTVPYDQTVIVDLTGGDDQILARMRARGRQNVRKALRESPAVCADETEQASHSFDEYYDVMVDTAKRDGFAPAPKQDYEDMLQELGPEHCRLFVSRIDGKVVNWCLVTLNDNRAVYYYGCMSTAVRRLRVPDKMFYHIFCTLGAQGVQSLDMMGIGSDFAPSLKGLNQFKTKFAPDITPVAAGHDIPIKRGFYGLLRFIQKLRKRGNAEH
ncbi:MULTISPECIES: GNAT family N-acetyltransferase [Bifidobacterium]|uniref:FemAB domain protein n=1 Tax=Bifidobacterium reuteri DSM 23975 TaxID=1437610 RepID=A0A087CSN0_9BIFI|nr:MULTISPECIES: GNAT family N-acetyltransferase [Bifidobacterium]KFI86280.1 FemAB domain protein [Bifidobacterium reuteri DSM 23975]TPF81159.1 peptidoglycan bridge formation protein FemAB [Bifidobacterium sp. UTCIF-24]TPF91500.1 peptidoglycan bridge formation protein FemAB [Bifidobacterium sp. UTBIF-56]TPF94620.1 peptidoglycan bridge formation protein FemAB [Bifidobacterium sp. UTBIF-68]